MTSSEAPERRCERVPLLLQEVAGHQCGREGQHHDGHQQDDVEQQDRAVDGSEPAQRRMVVDPDDPDGEERHDVCREVRPLLPEPVGQRRALLRLGHSQVDHQQGDRHRDHPVGERFETRLVHRGGLYVLHAPSDRRGGSALRAADYRLRMRG
jgi:hypothetical protein